MIPTVWIVIFITYIRLMVVYVQSFNLTQLLRSHRGESQDTVIRNLNPLIKGWSNYYKTVVARKTFEKADHLMFQKL